MGGYPGPSKMFVLFPDHGAYDRYQMSVKCVLKLDPDHVLYMQKTRIGESTEQVQTLFFENDDGTRGEKTEFDAKDSVLIIDDFTNSGGTLLGAVNLIQGKTHGDQKPIVNIFVSHLVATYDPQQVASLSEKLHNLGESTRLFVTNSIPMTTSLLKDDPQ